MNRQAQRELAGHSRLEVIPGATHLFEEPGTLQQVADLAAAWFVEQLQRPVTPDPVEGRPPQPGNATKAPRAQAPPPPAAALPDPILGYRDRVEAGELLARALQAYRGRDCVVLGLPRGGVEVGAVLAHRLEAALDVLLVRKLPAPPQPE